MDIRSHSLEETRGFAEKVLSSFTKKDEASILSLTGDLGAGKTAFVKELAAVLGVEETVQSPTFVVMKTYKTKHPDFSSLVHIDAYRLETPQEANVLRLDEVFKNPNNLVCIEWAEKLGDRPALKEITCRLEEDGTHTYITNG